MATMTEEQVAAMIRKIAQEMEKATIAADKMTSAEKKQAEATQILISRYDQLTKIGDGLEHSLREQFRQSQTVRNALDKLGKTEKEIHKTTSDMIAVIFGEQKASKEVVRAFKEQVKVLDELKKKEEQAVATSKSLEFFTKSLSGKFESLSKGLSNVVGWKTSIGGALGLSLGMKELGSTLSKYNRDVFESARIATMYGRSLSSVEQGIEQAAKTTTLSKQAFAEINKSFQEMYVGVPLTTSAVATLASKLQNNLGYSAEMTAKAMQDLLSLQSRMPDVVDRVSDAIDAYSSGSGSAIQKTMALRGHLKDLGLSAQDIRKYMAMATPQSGETKKLLDYEKSAANVAKAAEDAQLSTAQKLEGQMKFLNNQMTKVLKGWQAIPPVVMQIGSAVVGLGIVAPILAKMVVGLKAMEMQARATARAMGMVYGRHGSAGGAAGGIQLFDDSGREVMPVRRPGTTPRIRSRRPGTTPRIRGSRGGRGGALAMAGMMGVDMFMSGSSPADMAQDVGDMAEQEIEYRAAEKVAQAGKNIFTKQYSTVKGIKAGAGALRGIKGASILRGAGGLATGGASAAGLGLLAAVGVHAGKAAFGGEKGREELQKGFGEDIDAYKKAGFWGKVGKGAAMAVKSPALLAATMSGESKEYEGQKRTADAIEDKKKFTEEYLRQIQLTGKETPKEKKHIEEQNVLRKKAAEYHAKALKDIVHGTSANKALNAEYKKAESRKDFAKMAELEANAKTQTLRMLADSGTKIERITKLQEEQVKTQRDQVQKLIDERNIRFEILEGAEKTLGIIKTLRDNLGAAGEARDVLVEQFKTGRLTASSFGEIEKLIGVAKADVAAAQQEASKKLLIAFAEGDNSDDVLKEILKEKGVGADKQYEEYKTSLKELSSIKAQVAEAQEVIAKAQKESESSPADESKKEAINVANKKLDELRKEEQKLTAKTEKTNPLGFMDPETVRKVSNANMESLNKIKKAAEEAAKNGQSLSEEDLNLMKDRSRIVRDVAKAEADVATARDKEAKVTTGIELSKQERAQRYMDFQEEGAEKEAQRARAYNLGVHAGYDALNKQIEAQRKSIKITEEAIAVGEKEQRANLADLGMKEGVDYNINDLPGAIDLKLEEKKKALIAAGGEENLKMAQKIENTQAITIERHEKMTKNRFKLIDQETKIAELTKEVMEGYLAANKEFIANAGVFSGIIGSTKKGITQLIGGEVGALAGRTTGALASATLKSTEGAMRFGISGTLPNKGRDVTGEMADISAKSLTPGAPIMQTSPEARTLTEAQIEDMSRRGVGSKKIRVSKSKNKNEYGPKKYPGSAATEGAREMPFQAWKEMASGGAIPSGYVINKQKTDQYKDVISMLNPLIVAGGIPGQDSVPVDGVGLLMPGEAIVTGDEEADIAEMINRGEFPRMSFGGRVRRSGSSMQLGGSRGSSTRSMGGARLRDTPQPDWVGKMGGERWSLGKKGGKSSVGFRPTKEADWVKQARAAGDWVSKRKTSDDWVRAMKSGKTGGSTSMESQSGAQREFAIQKRLIEEQQQNRKRLADYNKANPLGSIGIRDPKTGLMLTGEKLAKKIKENEDINKSIDKGIAMQRSKPGYKPEIVQPMKPIDERLNFAGLNETEKWKIIASESSWITRASGGRFGSMASGGAIQVPRGLARQFALPSSTSGGGEVTLKLNPEVRDLLAVDGRTNYRSGTRI